MNEKYAISLDVSIPQGTIKSVSTSMPRALTRLFQFHKVRLKARG